jgi:hypothetical protein
MKKGNAGIVFPFFYFILSRTADTMTPRYHDNFFRGEALEPRHLRCLREPQAPFCTAVNRQPTTDNLQPTTDNRQPSPQYELFMKFRGINPTKL